MPNESNSESENKNVQRIYIEHNLKTTLAIAYIGFWHILTFTRMDQKEKVKVFSMTTDSCIR